MDLFDLREQQATLQNAPLAARMRPRTLAEYVGQEHILAPGRLLRRAIEADRLSSLIFYGPPGTGKTTLAEVIALRTRAHFVAINAVLAGVKDLREAIEGARERLRQGQQQTVLFIDEVHRFNKAQQDALLPWVEKGTVILIGATTENPYFEVNKALVSRSRVFQLRSLNHQDLRMVLYHAISDPERGYGQRHVVIDEDAREHLINVSNGDARSLLGALELAVETTPPDERGRVHISLDVAQESIQQRAVLYDKEGDAHFDIISAFIKSLRGSDPDAALYWLAKMVYAGEDSRFILRRLLIFASEDVGLAQPEAVSVVESCAAAFDRVGMPEGRYHLAQATLYLATAQKSNSTMGFFDALASIEREQEDDVPVHLKDAKRDKHSFGHGKGYLYPHAYRDHWVAQQYLPSSLQGRLFYTPSRQGYEAQIHDEVTRRRDAQLSAMLEREERGLGPAEILTYTPDDPALNRWLERTISAAGQALERLRDALFSAAQLVRHHIVLDLNAANGLLTWEAIRQTPEGGVWARCATEAQALALTQRATQMPELLRPTTLTAPLAQLTEALPPALRFDRIIGRHALVSYDMSERVQLLTQLRGRLLAQGRVVLAEGVPSATQRLVDLCEDPALDPALLMAWRQAESLLYHRQDDPMLSWDEGSMREAFERAGFEHIELIALPATQQRLIPAAQLDRWFPAQETDRPSYAAHLRAHLSADQVAQIERVMRARLTQATVPWSSLSMLIIAS